jgi:hypothetical protein
MPIRDYCLGHSVQCGCTPYTCWRRLEELEKTGLEARVQELEMKVDAINDAIHSLVSVMEGRTLRGIHKKKGP